MNIIIPMSGLGSRFFNAGYTIPKAFIEIEGKPIIQHVVDRFDPDDNFIFVFFIPMSQGMMSTETCNEITLECEVVDDDIFSVVIGYALSGCFLLILIAIWSQVLMALIGKGKFVVTENNNVTLRTSKSGIRSSSSIGNMIMNRMAKGFMSSADLDGDGKISYEEAIDMYFEDASKSEKPWEWDFKEAYERISKRFDLPP